MVGRPRPGRRADPRRRLFVEVVERHGGNLTRAAKELRVSRKTASAWWKLHQEGRLLAGSDS